MKIDFDLMLIELKLVCIYFDICDVRKSRGKILAPVVPAPSCRRLKKFFYPVSALCLFELIYGYRPSYCNSERCLSTNVFIVQNATNKLILKDQAI